MVALGVEFNLPRFYLARDFDQGGVGTFGAVRYAGRAAGAFLLTQAPAESDRPVRRPVEGDVDLRAA